MPVPGGDVSFSLSQDGATVVGTVDFTGWGCFDRGTMECQVMGNMITDTFGDEASHLNFTASCSGPGDRMMDGSFEMMTNGSCLDDMGSFHLERPSGSMAPPPPGEQAPWSRTLIPLRVNGMGTEEDVPANGSP